jgi:hypothetical protein
MQGPESMVTALVDHATLCSRKALVAGKSSSVMKDKDRFHVVNEDHTNALLDGKAAFHGEGVP